MIFCHLQLSYPDFHAAVSKFANALESGGLFAIGQLRDDTFAREGKWADEGKSYLQDYNAPFVAEPLSTFMMSARGAEEDVGEYGVGGCLGEG
ncbi:hypothetical protein BDZ45DRAFT_163036 [Acephala macrosclerotiorum]|nr:hypothetical protein BDZ45DRAFT_163036 [Acephala macrosclerotiorum]